MPSIKQAIAMTYIKAGKELLIAQHLSKLSKKEENPFLPIACVVTVAHHLERHGSQP
ncbi:hypothetical protein U1Q18_017540, partial [Sarracenia purpurea var. burkii]